MLIEIREGTVIQERFEIRGYVGGGGFGTVWHAFDKKLEREVAIKRFKTKSAFQAVDRDEVFGEARKIASLSHPNIVSVYEVVEHQGEPLICMEFLHGGSLHEYLRRKSREGTWVSAIEAVRLIKSILLGLNEAHNCERGPIIHKDLKPRNILFDRARQLKIVDFGLATVGAVPEIPTAHPGKWPHEGTFGYMSPEQLRGAQMDQRSDLFNVGLIAYLLFAAIHPFIDQRFLFDYKEMVIEPYQILPLVSAANLPIEVGEFVATLLAVDPERRFQSTAEALSELENVEGRFQHLTLQRSLEFLEAMLAGEPLESPSAEEIAESILLCKRNGLYDKGALLYERSGTDFSGLSEDAKARLEEDYRVCKKRAEAGRTAA
ncbi:MAG: serine/threonine-protein kinase [Blastocatellia bacterium]